MDTTLKIIARSNRNHTTSSEPDILLCPTLEQTTRKFLHLAQTLNTHVSQVQRHEQWHSNNKELAALGAHTKPITTYLQNNMTWFNAYQGPYAHNKQRSLLLTLVKAIASSTNARAAGISTLPIDILHKIAHDAGPQAHMHIIATIPPNTIKTCTPIYTSVTNSCTRRLNTLPTHLCMIETTNIIPTDTKSFFQEIATLAPGVTIHGGRTYTNKQYTLNHPRADPLKTPTLAFFLKTPTILTPQQNPSKIETHHRVTGAIGILPTNLQRHLSHHGHKPERGYIDSTTRNEISTILRETAFEAYAQYEQYMKRRKRGAT